jgi:hypothetical protein
MNWAFVITLVLTAVEFVIGFFAIFSRWGSLVTTVISTVSLLFPLSSKSPLTTHRHKPSSPSSPPQPQQQSTAPSPVSSRPSLSPTTSVPPWVPKCSPSSGSPSPSPSALVSSGSSAYAAAAERAATRRWWWRRPRTRMRGLPARLLVRVGIRCTSGLAVRRRRPRWERRLLMSHLGRVSRLWTERWSVSWE